MDFPVQEALRILRALEYQVEQTGPEELRVTTPPHRLDIQSGSADLIEDLVRIYGYDHLPATLLADRLPEQHTNRPLQLEEHIRDILVTAGLQEVVTYALTELAKEAPLGLPKLEYVRLLNPITTERVVMRHSVLASVLEIAAANLRHASDVRLFEVGSVYLPRPGEKLPDEPRRLALVMTGPRRSEFWSDTGAGPIPAMDFFDLKGVVEALAADLHLPEVRFGPAHPNHLHPGKAAELVMQGNAVGTFGVLHPKVAEAYGLTGHDVLAAEFDLEAILNLVPERYAYIPVPRFPAALRDIAVTVDEDVSAERLLGEIRSAGGNLLRGVRLFDLYRGESIPAGKKSLAYALVYQADDRTLVDKEVDKIHKKIEDRLKHVLKAQVRGEEVRG
jgi:phenylalanyl-tRNA synthetase beta chain